MLILENRYREVERVYRQSIIDRFKNVISLRQDNAANQRFRGSYVHIARCTYEQLPIITSDFKFSMPYAIVTDNPEDYNNLEVLLSALPEQTEDKTKEIVYLTLLTDQINLVDSVIDKDLWKKQEGNKIESLYNKTNADTKERNETGVDIKTNVYLHHDKNIVILVTNYIDYNQASEYFLTLGLLPVFFPCFKDKLEPEEKEFFKVLVRRSQVKRIRNTDAETAYETINSLSKVTQKIEEQRRKNELERLVQQRKLGIENGINDCKNELENLLDRYSAVLMKRR